MAGRRRGGDGARTITIGLNQCLMLGEARTGTGWCLNAWWWLNFDLARNEEMRLIARNDYHNGMAPGQEPAITNP